MNIEQDIPSISNNSNSNKDIDIDNDNDIQKCTFSLGNEIISMYLSMHQSI
jgi:hypothetical protein